MTLGRSCGISSSTKPDFFSSSTGTRHLLLMYFSASPYSSGFPFSLPPSIIVLFSICTCIFVLLTLCLRCGGWSPRDNKRTAVKEGRSDCRSSARSCERLSLCPDDLSEDLIGVPQAFEKFWTVRNPGHWESGPLAGLGTIGYDLGHGTKNDL